MIKWDYPMMPIRDIPMNCPYCGRPCEEDWRICPHCGRSLFPSPAAESTDPETASPPSSGPACASLVLSLLALLLVVLSLVITVVAIVWVGNFLQARDPRILDWIYSNPAITRELLQRDPVLRQALETAGTATLVGLGLFLLAELGACLGLVLGAIGLAQEKIRPTLQGRTHSTIGIVLSIFPLLCCLGLLILFFASLAAR